jgi:DNA-binding LacI/PurR family transcriptional regulator
MPRPTSSKRPRPDSRPRTTLNDVAREAGVCKASVSYVINGKPGVGPDVRRKIQGIMRRLGYRPSPAARHLTLRKTNLLGIVIQDLTPGWLLSIFHGMLIKATMSGYHAVTAVSAQEGDEFDLPVRMLADTSVEGLLWLDPRVTEGTIRKFRRQRMPFVLVENSAGGSDVPSISTDNAQGARDAVNHLLGLGRRRLMVVTGQNFAASSRQRMEGVKLACRDHGVRLAPGYILNGHYNGPLAVEAFDAFLASGKPMPDAIFAFNDNMALALLQRLNARRVRVPQDVAVAGFDGTVEAEQAGLTTIETPMREMGVMAAQMLIDIVENKGPARPPQQVLIKGVLRARRTSG